MMRGFSKRAAFTLAEALIGMVANSVVLGALLLSCIELQKSLHASERYASYQCDQRRLLDCLSRDMRRSIGIGTSTAMNGSGATRLSGTSATIEGQTSLVLTLPGYYQSNVPTDATYDKPLGIVAADNYVDYGSGGQHSPGVPVIFRKDYIQDQGCVCFVRIEGDAQSILVKDADNLHLTVTMDPDGRSGMVEVTFVSPRHGSETRITVRDQMLLRNIRLD